MAEIEFGSDDRESMLAAMKQEDEAGKFVSKYWKPTKEGMTKIRFLPKLKSNGEDFFYQKHLIHYVNGIPYFCLAQTLTDKDGNVHEIEECPFCKKSKQLYRAADRDKESTEWKMAGELRAKERYVSRIIVRGNKDKDGNDIEFKPEFFEFGQTIREMIMSALDSGEFGQPLDLKTGRDFSINKKGQKKQTKYDGSMFSGNATPIFTDATKLKALLAELKNMDYNQLVEFKSVKELQNVLKEYLEEDDDEDEVIESSSDELEEATYASKPKASKKHDEVEEAEDEESDESADDGDDLDSLLNSI